MPPICGTTISAAEPEQIQQGGDFELLHKVGPVDLDNFGRQGGCGPSILDSIWDAQTSCPSLLDPGPFLAAKKSALSSRKPFVITMKK